MDDDGVTVRIGTTDHRLVLTAKAFPLLTSHNDLETQRRISTRLACHAGLHHVCFNYCAVDDHHMARHEHLCGGDYSTGRVHPHWHHGKEELKQINWDVLWLVAGGIAIGIGLEQTGLAQALAHAIDYQSLSPMLIVIALSLVCWLMANFMSNTATANLIMPIAAAIGTSMSSLEQVGGLQALLVVVAFPRHWDDFARFDTAQLARLLNGTYRKQRYGQNWLGHWSDWAWHRLSDGVPTRINSLFPLSFTPCRHF